MEPKCGAWRQNGGRLGGVTEAGRPVLRGLEVILQILRLGGHFCGDHGASAPPPSCLRVREAPVYFQSDTLTVGITRLDSNTPVLNKVVDELLVQVHAQNISIRGLELSLA